MNNIRITGDKELILYLDRTSKRLDAEYKDVLEDVGDHLEKKVKEKFGKYQNGWAKLKRATVIAKYRKRALSKITSRTRFNSLVARMNVAIGDDDPLVLFGNLRDSIKHEVNMANLESVTYSDNPYSAVHEYGHKHVPARSYMRLTLWDEEEYIMRLVSARIGNVIRR
jgi:phage gpG-like protein